MPYCWAIILSTFSLGKGIGDCYANRAPQEPEVLQLGGRFEEGLLEVYPVPLALQHKDSVLGMPQALTTFIQ